MDPVEWMEFDSSVQRPVPPGWDYCQMVHRIIELSKKVRDFESKTAAIPEDVGAAFADIKERLGKIEDDYLKAADKSGLEKEIQGLDSRLSTAENDIDELQRKMDAVEASVGSMEGTVSEHENEILGLQSDTQQLNEDVESLQSADSALSGRIDSLESALEDAGITELEGRVAANESAIDDLRAEVVEAQDAADAAQAAADACVKKAGDAMSGTLKVPDGVDPGDAVNKGQLDAAIAAAEAKVGELVAAYLAGHPDGGYIQKSADGTYYKTAGDLPIAVEGE